MEVTHKSELGHRASPRGGKAPPGERGATYPPPQGVYAHMHEPASRRRCIHLPPFIRNRDIWLKICSGIAGKCRRRSLIPIVLREESCAVPMGIFERASFPQYVRTSTPKCVFILCLGIPYLPLHLSHSASGG